MFCEWVGYRVTWGAMVEVDEAAACQRRLRFLSDVGAAENRGRISKRSVKADCLDSTLKFLVLLILSNGKRRIIASCYLQRALRMRETGQYSL
jgi:hypothetical protein